MREYDVVIVGGGPAGGGAASILAEAGKSVAMVESRGFGGVCPLRGCNPKKVLLAGAEVVEMVRHMRGNGVQGDVHVHWPELARFKDGFVDPIPEQAENHYLEIGCDTYHGLARFIGPDTLYVEGEDTEELRGRHIVLGPGMRPRDLDIPGKKHLSISDDFLDLSAMPARVVFIGGGFVAMELAHIAARAGGEVTVVVRSRPLKAFDPDLVDKLVEASREAGIDVLLGTEPHSLEKTDKRLILRVGKDGSQAIKAKMVVNCAGRVPDLDPLHLDVGEVAYSRRGLKVNEFMQSVSNERVYCSGDGAATPFALTPTATIESQAAAHNILNGNSLVPDYTGVPQVAYTIPPVASCGLSEVEAREQGLDFKAKIYDLGNAFSWKRLGTTTGMSKVLVDETTDRILGAHVMGHNAEEMINLFALIIRGNIPLSTVRSTVWAYPTSGYYLKYMV